MSSWVVHFSSDCGFEGGSLLIEHGSGCNFLKCFITELQIFLESGSVLDAEPDNWCCDEDGNGAKTELKFSWLAKESFRINGGL